VSVMDERDLGEMLVAALKYVGDVAKSQGGANDRDILRATLDLWGALMNFRNGSAEMSDANVQVSGFHHGDWTRKQKFAGAPKNAVAESILENSRG